MIPVSLKRDDLAGGPAADTAPRVIFVMPAYGHPVLMTEALESVLAQSSNVPFRVVLVSDGCTLSETDTVCRAYALAQPWVIYLRKPNGGPGSARNRGIDFALATWPALRAIFFIDADNRLAPSALEDAWQALLAHPDAGWIYTNLDSFGMAWSGNYEVPYAPLMHVIHDNICDTGALVHRRVFDAGVRFDEDGRAGFEDWDFFLQALRQGFHGQPASFGFAYRRRPESRYRAMSRSRAAALDYLRSRHRDLSRAATLVAFEHRLDPRYALRLSEGGGIVQSTDPACPHPPVSDALYAERFWAALAEPDNHALAPFFCWGSTALLSLLARWKLLHGIFWLAERSCAQASWVALTFQTSEGEIGVSVGPPADPASLPERGLLWMCANREVKRLALDPDASLSFRDGQASGSILEIILRVPERSAADVPAAYACLEAGVAALRTSPFAAASPRRWTWRPMQFPARDTYAAVLREYLEAETVMPRLAEPGRKDIGILVALASFGGAEKVTYAMARNLRLHGARTHLFVLGAPSVKILSEYAESFDSVSFLVDPELSLWGGSTLAFGQELFPPDSPELKAAGLVGLLAGLDVIINCHSAPINSVMGKLRSQGARCATYLHVTDLSPLGRFVGHTYLTVPFEHVYDRILTCSMRLADDLHALGVPAEKLIVIPNAGGFTPSAELKNAARRLRIEPRGERPLNVLYIGRLDRQKGVERLYALVRRAIAEAEPVAFRIIGGTLVEDSQKSWAAKFAELGIDLQPPIYDSEQIGAHYAWADVLVLPSRWEGAPLVIAESQSLGCIPLATEVGAVAEMLTPGVDGLVVPNEADEATASSLLAALRRLVADDDLRRTMALAGLARSDSRSWDVNFAPLREWLGI